MKYKNFTEWWESNSQDYIKEGVSKIVAKTIWSAAVNAFESNLLKKFDEYY